MRNMAEDKPVVIQERIDQVLREEFEKLLREHEDDILLEILINNELDKHSLEDLVEILPEV